MSVKTFLKSGLVVVALLLLSNGARANVHLMGSPQVRRELKVSHAVSLQILYNLNLVARANAGGAMTQEQFQKQRALQQSVDAKAVYEQTMHLLSGAQKQRLQQLNWQSIGDHIWSDPEVRRRLKLTATQHNELLQADERSSKIYVRGVQKLFKDNRDWYGTADRKRHAAKYAAYQRQFEVLGVRSSRDLRAVVQRVFTARQKAEWKKLLGQPFDMRHLRYDTEIYPAD